MSKSIDFPSYDHVQSVIPTGRAGYIEAANRINALRLTDRGADRSRQLGWALRRLAEAHQVDELNPPLPINLGSLLVKMNDSIETEGQGVHGHAMYENFSTIELAVTAAIDHGNGQQSNIVV